MTRKLIITAVASLLALVLMGTVGEMAGANSPVAESSKAIMKKLNGKAATSVSNKLKKELGEGKPDWKAVKVSAKEYADLTAELEKNEAKKGEAESWKKLTAAYSADAKELHEAAEKEDLDSSKAAAKKLGASCKTCHTAHR